MEYGEQRYRKLIEKYTYDTFQSNTSHSSVARVKEFPSLKGTGAWPAKAIENLKEIILENLQEMDSRGEQLPGEDIRVNIFDPENPKEYQAFLRSNSETAAKALMIAAKYGLEDGKHHKTWVIDQMIRELTGNQYEAFIEHACNRNGKDSGEWDEGNVP